MNKERKLGLVVSILGLYSRGLSIGAAAATAAGFTVKVLL